MKTSVKLSSLFLALVFITSCSLQEEGLFERDLQLKNDDLTKTSEISKVIPGSYIIVFKDHVVNPAAEAGMLSARFGLEKGHVYEHALKGFSASVPDKALKGLQNHPLIDYIEADITMHANAQTIPTGVKRIAAIHSTGTIINVGVAILDTGIDADHPDLNVSGGIRFYRGRFTDSKYDDDNGHGSHVAGTVGAKDNDIGVVGVAPGASLWAVKVLDARGSGYLSDIIKGLDWVTARATTIKVINMSLSGQGVSNAYRKAIQNCVEAGIVVVVAAGNDSRDVYGNDGIFETSDDIIPAAYPEVATISALADSDGIPGGKGSPTSYGDDDSFASFSNFSRSVDNKDEPPVISPGAAIDLILPGVSILSTYKNGGYATASGTSMASPHAAGLVALYIANNELIPSSATDVYNIRQALIDAGKAQNDSEYGLFVQNDPDNNKENLGWAGTGTVDPPVNQPPVADFSYSISDLTVAFTDKSTDSDGTIASWSWDFGDESTTSYIQNPIKTYNAAGTYKVTLTVTDNKGLSGSKDKSISVPEESGGLVLTAVAYKVKGRQKVDLTWTGATNVVIYRDEGDIATLTGSSYTDNIDKVGGGSYTYKVEDVSTTPSTWSNEVTVTF